MFVEALIENNHRSRGPPRPYVTSSFHINFHLDENKISFESLSQFLISAGKIRQKAANKFKVQEDATLSNENPIPSSTEAFHNKDKLITIGLRQTLKAYNNNKLKWILLDSTMISPSAVGQVMGLLATNGTKETKFYVIPELSTEISKVLNLPKINTIGFGSDCLEIEKMISTLHCIDITAKKKSTEVNKQPSSSTFVPPPMEVPKGKSHTLSKKQRKKLAGKKK